MRYSKWLYLIW